MPRRSRRTVTGKSAVAVDTASDIEAISDRLLGPAGARLTGYEVRSSAGKGKQYRCPYCEGTIAPGEAHIVSVPSGRPEARRHYHSGCWNKVVRAGGSPVS